MIKRRLITIQLDGYASWVKGWKSRELVIEVTGRAPMWMSTTKAWCIQQHTARDVIAAAERKGYDIEVRGPRGGNPIPTSAPKCHARGISPVSRETPVTPGNTSSDDRPLW